VPWSAATDIADLIEQLPPDLQAYTPRLSYILIDEERHMPPEGLNNLLSHLIRFAHAQDMPARMHHLEMAMKLVQNNSFLDRHIRAWLQALWVQKNLSVADLPADAPQGDFIMAFKFGWEKWAEGMQGTWLQQGVSLGIEQGIERGIEQGIEKGIHQGELILLQRQLAKRFGRIPDEVLRKIQQASAQDLERWAERVLDAPALNAVLDGIPRTLDS
jgi:hypothetical protein